MTPNRERYLNDISKEERIIRARIRFLKDDISNDKHALNTVSLIRNFRKSCIKENKILIKNLKKQLPAPVLAGETCSVCDFSHEDSLIFPSYCACCGQKLR